MKTQSPEPIRSVAILKAHPTRKSKNYESHTCQCPVCFNEAEMDYQSFRKLKKRAVAYSLAREAVRYAAQAVPTTHGAYPLIRKALRALEA